MPRISHDTKTLARSFLAVPDQWCEVCSGDLPADPADVWNAS